MSIYWTSLPGVSGRRRTRNDFTRRLMMAGCVFVVSAALAGCGRGGAVNNSNNASGPVAAENQQTAILLPPGMDNRPLQPGQSGGEFTPDGLPALQPARGVNIENLFAENIKDPVERVKRVENAVVELRRDFNAVLPAIVRLSAVEADMQELLRQLESLLRSEPPAANPVNLMAEEAAQTAGHIAPATSPPQEMTPPAPQDAAIPPAQITPESQASPPPASISSQARVTPPANTGPQTVTALRLGEHPGKTRLVMDITGAAPYNYDIDNAENLLVIELPQTGWRAAQTQTLAKSPFIQSYNVQPMDGGGSRVIIQLKGPVRVSYEAALRPEADQTSHRIVLDLQGA